MKFGWIFSGALAAGLVALIAGAALSEQPTKPREQDLVAASRILPSTEREELVDLPQARNIAGNGIIEPADREIKVAGATGGRIAEIKVREGDRVKKGDLLVELEKEVEIAALAAAEADLAVARAELSKIKKGLRVEDVDATIADAEAAKTRAELSAGTARRIEQLAPSGAATQDELDKARKQAAIDERSARAAEARRRAAEAGSRHEDIAVAAARVAAAAARRDQLAATLDRLSVRSPIEGEVLVIKARPGELYTPGGEALAIVGDTSKLRARMDVDERDVAKVSAGARAYVTTSAFPGKKFEGRVVEIARRMGRKNVRTDDPVERIDTKVLEAVIEISEPRDLVVGMRVLSYVDTENVSLTTAQPSR